MAKKESYIPKPVIIPDEAGNPEYTLEFDRDTVDWCEKREFKLGDVFNFPKTGFSELFFYSFRMNQKGMNKFETDKIWDELGVDRKALIGRLYDLYNYTLESLTEDTTESPNAKRKVVL
jgi:hypothetical protein